MLLLSWLFWLWWLWLWLWMGGGGGGSDGMGVMEGMDESDGGAPTGRRMIVPVLVPVPVLGRGGMSCRGGMS